MLLATYHCKQVYNITSVAAELTLDLVLSNYVLFNCIDQEISYNNNR